MTDLLSLNDAVRFRIPRLRLPHWSNPRDYIRIEITEDGELGCRFQLYSHALSYLGVSNPQIVTWASVEADPDLRVYLPYLGDTP